MQKVEGSNPFSRFEKGLHLQLFFVRSRLVRLRRRAPNGHPADNTRRERLRTIPFAGIPDDWSRERTLDRWPRAWSSKRN
jgi:hypothetical protein